MTIDPLTDFRADMPTPTAAYLSRTRESLLSAAPRRNRRRMRIAIAGAGAVSAAAGLIAATFVGASPAAAASVLEQAAHAAAGQPATAVRPGQYTFLESTTRGIAPGSDGLRTTTAQEWIPVDGKGPGLIRDTSGSEIHLQDGVLVSKNPYPLPAGVPTTPIKGAPALAPLDHPSYDYLLTLPTEPHALLDVIGAQADQDHSTTTRSREQEEFYIIAEATSHAYLPPTIRAAFYQAAALIPGVSTIKDVKLGDGRTGTAASRVAGSEQLELVFDPNTFALIGDQVLKTADGSVLEASTVTGSGIVDQIGQRP